MNDKYKLGEILRDINKEIQGQVCNILENGDIHIEYARFKGDTELFYISYDTKEQDEYLMRNYEDEEGYKLKSSPHQYGLTIKELRKYLSKVKLPGNAYVCIEYDNAKYKENELNKTFFKGTSEEIDTQRTWSAGRIEKNLMIYVNY
jgi:hypothetical protein